MSDDKEEMESKLGADKGLGAQLSAAQKGVAGQADSGRGVTITPGVAPSPEDSTDLVFTGGPKAVAEQQAAREAERAENELKAQEAAKQAQAKEEAAAKASYDLMLWNYIKLDPGFPKSVTEERDDFNVSAVMTKRGRLKEWLFGPSHDLIVKRKHVESAWENAESVNHYVKENILWYLFGQKERVNIDHKDGQIHIRADFTGNHAAIGASVDAASVIAKKEYDMAIAIALQAQFPYGIENVSPDELAAATAARKNIIDNMPDEIRNEIFTFEITKVNNSTELNDMLAEMAKKDPKLIAQLSPTCLEAVSKMSGLGNAANELIKNETERHARKKDKKETTPEGDTLTTDNAAPPAANDASKKSSFKPR